MPRRSNIAMEIITRIATKKDLPAISTLYREFADSEYALDFPVRDYLVSIHDRKRHLSMVLDEFSNPTRTWIVAEVDDVVVGTALVTVEQDLLFGGKAARIELVVVASGFRKRGVAQKIMDFSRELAIKKGCRCAFLEVFDYNDGARSLYERSGFQTYSRKMFLPLDAKKTRSES